MEIAGSSCSSNGVKGLLACMQPCNEVFNEIKKLFNFLYYFGSGKFNWTETQVRGDERVLPLLRLHFPLCLRPLQPLDRSGPAHESLQQVCRQRCLRRLLGTFFVLGLSGALGLRMVF